MRSFAFKLAMWVLVAVLTLLIAFGVGLAFLICVPVVVVYSIWEFFIGRRKDPIEVEHQRLIAEARAHG